MARRYVPVVLAFVAVVVLSAVVTATASAEKVLPELTVETKLEASLGKSKLSTSGGEIKSTEGVAIDSELVNKRSGKILLWFKKSTLDGEACTSEGDSEGSILVPAEWHVVPPFGRILLSLKKTVIKCKFLATSVEIEEGSTVVGKISPTKTKTKTFTVEVNVSSKKQELTEYENNASESVKAELKLKVDGTATTGTLEDEKVSVTTEKETELIEGSGGGKESTTLTTSLSGEGKEGAEITVLEGSKVKDKAKLSGKNASKATGKVKYDVYSDSKCEHRVTAAGEGTASGETVTASEEKELEGGKTYYWQASYEGDSNNDASTSTCSSEVLNVMASTTLSTKLSGESEEGSEITVLEDAKVTDKVTLTGTNSSGAGGKVLYKIFSDKECKTLVKEAGEVSVSSGSVPASSEEELEGGKTYYWQATYKGDSLHEESTSSCGSEVLKVKAKTTLATKLSGESKEGEELTVLEGSEVKDKATLTGTNSSTAGGKVLYKVFSDSKCEDLVIEAGEETVTSGSVPASNEEELEGGKTYYWQATYKGDSLHQESKSECGKEIANIQAPTSLSTTLSGETQMAEELSVTEGAPVSDSATLTGPRASVATGTVKYDVYSDWECKDLVAEAGEATVAGEFVPASKEDTLPVGTYYWQAVYSGDRLNAPSTSTCGTEVVAVTPVVTTSLSGEGQSGEEVEVQEAAGVSDTATLHGEHASTASGTVKYYVYSDKECKDLVTAAGTVTVTSGSIPPSSEETLPKGTYYWQAVYSGDSEIPAATSACGSEVALVQTATSLSTSLSGESKSGAEIEVQETAGVADTATLSGANASTASGYVKYDVYSDPECKELVAEAGDVSVTSGSVPESEEETLPVGTYYWQAVYSGDEDNHSSTNVCGSEISIVTAPVTTSLSGEGQSGEEIEVEEAAAVRDTATLHGPHVATATGTVNYDVYSDPECKDLVTEAGEWAVTDGSVPSSIEETLPAGTYYWQASYSGDEDNPAAQSRCGTEVAIVKPPNAQYAALGDSFSAGLGAEVYYAKTTLPGAEENKCYRSVRAYPVRVAEALYPSSPVADEEEVFKQQPPRFIFRACNGAVTWNLGGVDFARGQYNEWIVGTPGRWLPTPEQSLWLTLPGGEEASTGPNEAITLVTLTIGGNDAGFATVGENCVFGQRPRGQPPYSVDRCKEVIKEWETGQPGAPATLLIPSTEEGIPSLKEKLPIVLRTIHESAPMARIRIPLYPLALNTARHPTISVGQTLLGFGIANPVPRRASVAVALEMFTDKLNQTIASTVQKWAQQEKVNARVIRGTVRALIGHQLGDPNPWMNGLILIRNAMGQLEAGVGSFHPNCRGQKAMAERVVQSLGRAVPGGWACP